MIRRILGEVFEEFETRNRKNSGQREGIVAEARTQLFCIATFNCLLGVGWAQSNLDQPKMLLGISSGPSLLLNAPAGTTTIVEWTSALGPGAHWQAFTNLSFTGQPVVLTNIFDKTASRYFRAVASVTPLKGPERMSLIPAGEFQMGDTFNDWTDSALEKPVHTVFVSSFFMDQYEVSLSLWDEVKAWSDQNGYTYAHVGSGQAADHPVQTVNWFDCVKWCNARSEKAGLTPAYYADAALTQVYRTGELAPYARWDTGFRLPTEAEWEKAARGGLEGRRFPWGDDDNITHARANYYSSSWYYYDTSVKRGLHPAYSDGLFSSPVGTFQPNPYGLFDMAGNVWEWCWDWQDWYQAERQEDPRGAASGTYRVTRGGGWYREAIYARNAYRGNSLPGFRGGGTGFRCVLTAR